MVCFVHEGVAAVGTCKFCGRGLCRECAAEVAGALACRARCEAVVAKLAGIALKPAGPQITTATGTSILGAVCAFYGWVADQSILLAMGVCLIGIGVASLVAMRRQGAGVPVQIKRS